MKRIGFLSFGHWNPSPHSGTRSAGDVLRQSIDLAVAAEELGADGAYFRVHHFAQQLASPFPMLAAIGAKTSKIEIGTGVIDMRYETPLQLAEEAAALPAPVPPSGACPACAGPATTDIPRTTGQSATPARTRRRRDGLGTGKLPLDTASTTFVIDSRQVPFRPAAQPASAACAIRPIASPIAFGSGSQVVPRGGADGEGGGGGGGSW